MTPSKRNVLTSVLERTSDFLFYCLPSEWPLCPSQGKEQFPQVSFSVYYPKTNTERNLPKDVQAIKYCPSVQLPAGISEKGDNFMCKDEEPRPEYVTVEGQKVKGQRYPSLVAKLPTLRIRNQITMYLSSFEIRWSDFYFCCPTTIGTPVLICCWQSLVVTRYHDNRCRTYHSNPRDGQVHDIKESWKEKLKVVVPLTCLGVKYIDVL